MITLISTSGKRLLGKHKKLAPDCQRNAPVEPVRHPFHRLNRP